MKLNEKQKEAVLETEGPVLILAGAGSGKTRVIVNKISYLINELDVNPLNILAITFTNKAAKEMNDRVAKLNSITRGMWIGTFHSVCVKILRRFGDTIGYNKFVIYDVKDQKSLMKTIFKKLGINDERLSINDAVRSIDSYKNKMISPKNLEDSANNIFIDELVKIYYEYERQLKKNNAMDFNDLLLKTIEIFKKSPEILEHYRDRFKYIFVDEYQDTNKPQYVLVKLLASKHLNLTVVGDVDQSIYAFRGADITNIQNFTKDYKDSKIIKLEENYRSTKYILDSANSVIENNTNRPKKNLFTSKEGGEKIILKNLYNEKEEADYVVDEIIRNKRKGIGLEEQAILYRTNAQSRIFESSLRKNGINYKIYGGLRFFDRAEVKDLIAYLNIIINPNDDISFMRIINVPKRKIGSVSIDKISTEDSFYKSVKKAVKENILSKKQTEELRKLLELIEYSENELDTLLPSEIINKIVDKVDYFEYLDKTSKDSSAEKKANVYEFINMATEMEEEINDLTLENFLKEIGLQTTMDTKESGEELKLMTMHNAKGLEFKAVYMVGVEDGLFPSNMSLGEEGGLEEERRLMYVSITRAEELLYITYTNYRKIFGIEKPAIISRFINEIPLNCIDDRSDKDVFEKQKIVTKNHSVKSYKEYMKDFNESKKSSVDNSDVEFKDGIRVSHKIFGKGIIVSSDDKYLNIAFDEVGMKKLSKTLAPLKIVD